MIETLMDDRYKTGKQTADDPDALKYKAAKKAAGDYGSMPRLSMYISPLEVGGGCGGDIRATVSAMLDRTYMRPTHTLIYAPSMEIWSHAYNFVGPQPTFSNQAIGIAEELIKELINDWTASQEESP
jgi:hypothetical protein